MQSDKTIKIDVKLASEAYLSVDPEKLPQRIAVGIILLPNDPGIQHISAINKKMIERGNPDTMKFEKNKCWPHLSLAMGCLPTKNFSKIVKAMETVAGQFGAFSLKVHGARKHKVRDTSTTISRLIIKTEENLMEFQRNVFGGVFNHLTYDATIDTLYPDPKPENISLPWINGYKDIFYHPDTFQPHIACGLGLLDVLDMESLETIFAPSIALAWLGNYCTVRQVLAECLLMGE